MVAFNLVAQTNGSTVAAEYVPTKKTATGFQSEWELEEDFIKRLHDLGYEISPIHTHDELIANLREQLTRLNRNYLGDEDFKFSDSEWKKFFNENLNSPNQGIKDKAELIQDRKNRIVEFELDNGEKKNIILFDRNNVHNNFLQVIHQFETTQEEGAKHDNRYDVTILVNGFPMVHIELKRRGEELRQAFNQINRYLRESFSAGSRLFEYIQIFVISNGTETKYYSNTTRLSHVESKKNSESFEFTSYWSDVKGQKITDLEDFTTYFFAKNTILNILAYFCVFTTEKKLMVMRPYQIAATEVILKKIDTSNNYKTYGKIEGGGYIWHTTGSGKTLTSFKTAQLAANLDYIDKVLFVVDRKDLDNQTIREYQRFEKNSAQGSRSAKALKGLLESDQKDKKIIITTIQKLAKFIRSNPDHAVSKKHVVIIFDECHRSHFGDMHQAIRKYFKKHHLFGFTGTPIFAANAVSGKYPQFKTTEQTFGKQLHTYTIVNAINDRNVLPFKVDFLRTMQTNEGMKDEQVEAIDKESVYLAPERITLVTKYILEKFNQKTNPGNKAKNNKGFNSIFAVSSIDAAKLYYEEFKRQQKDLPKKDKLEIALIYSYAANEDTPDGITGDENPEDMSALDQSSKDFLDAAIKNDYNKAFKTNFDTSSEKFYEYYQDVSDRMKKRKIDLLIVVNMFLTGFDAKTLNTLWVDKNLKMHGLLQAFSRTNRILNSVKRYGNIVCFRNLQKETDDAIALFGNKEARGLILMKTFAEYYKGYKDEKGKTHIGYEEVVRKLQKEFPLTSFPLTGDEIKKKFIRLYGQYLRLRNLLSTFDEFENQEILTERENQDYRSWYISLMEVIPSVTKTGITDGVVFEVELLKQININVDYIIDLIQKYSDSLFKDKELLANIRSAIDSSLELRSKKELIELFIETIGENSDVRGGWIAFINEQKKKDLEKIISEENLKSEPTERYMKAVFREGAMQTAGTQIDDLLKPMSRFGSAGKKRKEYKQRVIERLTKYFDTYIDAGF